MTLQAPGGGKEHDQILMELERQRWEQGLPLECEVPTNAGFMMRARDACIHLLSEATRLAYEAREATPHSCLS